MAAQNENRSAEKRCCPVSLSTHNYNGNASVSTRHTPSSSGSSSSPSSPSSSSSQGSKNDIIVKFLEDKQMECQEKINTWPTSIAALSKEFVCTRHPNTETPSGPLRLVKPQPEEDLYEVSNLSSPGDEEVVMDVASPRFQPLAYTEPPNMSSFSPGIPSSSNHPVAQMAEDSDSDAEPLKLHPSFSLYVRSFAEQSNQHPDTEEDDEEEDSDSEYDSDDDLSNLVYNTTLENPFYSPSQPLSTQPYTLKAPSSPLADYIPHLEYQLRKEDFGDEDDKSSQPPTPTRREGKAMSEREPVGVFQEARVEKVREALKVGRESIKL